MPLTDLQRAGLRAGLEALARRLREEIGRGARLPNHNEDTDDAAVADLETALEVADLERDTRELLAVEAALRRLEQPGFGLCEDCGAEIPHARLGVTPHATRCVACQSSHERSAAPAAKL